MSYIKGAFCITEGLAEVYVGLHITRDRDQHFIHLDQRRYLERVLKRFGHEFYNPVAVPTDPNSVAQLILGEASATTEPVENYPYRECVGCLQWASIGTRFDITYAVSNAARFSSCPKSPHVGAVKRILKYIKGTIGHRITYGRSDNLHQLKAYCDADFAFDLDDRKSRSGFILMMNNGPIAWGSRKQTCTSVSTTESEYVAACLATQELLWMRRLLASIRSPQQVPTTLFCNNQAAVRLSINPVFHQRTKHIDTKYHKTRDAQHDGEISIAYVPTREQLADLLTKALPRDQFIRLRSLRAMTIPPNTK